MSHLALYFIFVLGNLHYVLSSIVLPIIAGGVFVFGTATLICVVESCSCGDVVVGYLKLIVIAGAASILLLCFTPSMCQIAVIYAAPKILANKDVQEMPPKLVKLANVWLTKQLQDEIKKTGVKL